MFVGGLSPKTTEGESLTPFLTLLDDLYNYFSTFGDVIQTKVIYNKKTKNSKGYGFVTITSMQVFERIKSMTHKLAGRTLDINIGCKKSEAPSEIKNRAKRTVYVNGLPEGLPDGIILH